MRDEQSLRLSLYSSQSLWWPSDYPYTHHNLPGVADNLYTHHSLPGGTQNIPLLISLHCGTQTNPIRIIVPLVVLRIFQKSPQSTWWLRQSRYPSQSPSWYPNYPFTHHSLPGGTKTIHILITVTLVVLRQSLFSSQSPW